MNVRAQPPMLAASLVGFLCLLQAAQCQFLQPQSHLGRLVQSIASPLVLSGAYAGDSSDSDELPADVYGPGAGESAHGSQPGAAQHFQHYQREQQLQQPTRHHQYGQQLQQAPSQERGVPQHFYEGTRGGAAATSLPHKQRSLTDEKYRMGTYLGPTIDHKEIQGTFNSKDDERDDESADGFVGPPSALAGRQRVASSGQDVGSYGAAGSAGNTGEPSYGQHDGRVYGSTGTMRTYPTRGESSSSFEDESGADEDDDSAAAPSRRGRGPDPSHFRTSSGQAAAASQYHQQRRQHTSGASNQHQQQQQQMQAAANGYAPYGYPAGAGGPIDLSSLIGAPGGPGGYEVYNGDGSYPGAGYYQQQGNGRRNQASSNMMGAGPYGPYGSQQEQQGARGEDNDEQDSDADEDRA